LLFQIQLVPLHLGAYSNLRAESEETEVGGESAEDLGRSSVCSVSSVMSASYDPGGLPLEGGIVALLQKFGLFKGTDVSQMKIFRDTFDAIDADGGGSLEVDEFVNAFQGVNPALTEAQCRKIFDEADVDGSGDVDFEEFVEICKMGAGDMLKMLGTSNRDATGVLKVSPSAETYFGEKLRVEAPKSVNPFSLVDSQGFSMQLYETRIASLQRFVAMSVMFHELGKRVQDFWPAWTFGYLGYRIDRTHSIMRIATTASPVSGAEVRDRINYLTLRTELEKALGVISAVAINFKEKSKLMAKLAEMQGKPLRIAGAGMEKLINPRASATQSAPPPPRPGTLSARASDVSLSAKSLHYGGDTDANITIGAAGAETAASAVSDRAAPLHRLSGRNPERMLQPVAPGPDNGVDGEQEEAFVALPHAFIPGAVPDAAE
jgi:hypothetical protein